MFQISAVIGYAVQNKIDYFIPTWEYSRHFKYQLNQSALIKPMPAYHEKGFHYNRIPHYANIDLYGCFQSIRYWEHCEMAIRKMWQPNQQIQMLLDKNPFAPNTCAIHVRRTDYLQLKDYHASQPIE